MSLAVGRGTAGKGTWKEDQDEDLKEERRREGSWDILDHPDPSIDHLNVTKDKMGLTAAVTRLDDALSSLDIKTWFGESLSWPSNLIVAIKLCFYHALLSVWFLLVYRTFYSPIVASRYYVSCSSCYLLKIC